MLNLTSSTPFMAWIPTAPWQSRMDASAGACFPSALDRREAFRRFATSGTLALQAEGGKRNLVNSPDSTVLLRLAQIGVGFFAPFTARSQHLAPESCAPVTV